MAEKRPFRAYSGSGKYLFISYSHSDSKKVYEEIGKLFCCGCNVWYDQGIPNNTVLDRQISDAIKGCSVFILFLSKSSAASKYVMSKELPQARKLGKQVIFVKLYDDDNDDYAMIRNGEPLVSCGRLEPLVPAACRDCKKREPEPILVDMTNGMNLFKDQLVAAEYHFENNELVLDKYLNLGAANDDKDDLEQLRVPDYIAGHPLRKIMNPGAFSELEGETADLILPDTLTELGERVFEDADFERIVLPPSLRRIEYRCFADSQITEIDISYGVETICEEAFENCENLEQVEIPASVKRIEAHAFIGCTELACVTIPPQTTELGDDMIDEDGIVSIFCLEGSAAHRYAIKHHLDFNLMTDEEMDSEQKNIKEESQRRLAAFAERERKAAQARREDLGRTACIIADEADTEAIMPLLDNLRLDGVRFSLMYEPNSTLSDYAAVVMILSDTSCAKGTIPASAPEIRRPVYPIMLSGNAEVPEQFAGRFVIHQKDRTFDELYGDVRDWLASHGCGGNRGDRTSAMKSEFEYSFEERGEAYVWKHKGNGKNVVIPESWLGLTVTGIMSYAFNESSAETVTVGKNVKKIEYNAFYKCSKLKSVMIPPTVTDFDEKIFCDCGNAAICGAAGSAAHEYAVKNGIPFKAI